MNQGKAMCSYTGCSGTEANMGLLKQMDFVKGVAKTLES